MTRRLSIGSDHLTVDDSWDYYQTTRNSILRASGHVKRTMLFGASSARDEKFYGQSAEQVDAYFAGILDETDRQACLSLIASAEAALRIDFLERVYERKKDEVSRAFRAKFVDRCNHDARKVSLDEHILQTWKERMPESSSHIGDFRGALNYRHWLAHGRYWVPKLGRKYDPTGVLLIIQRVFSATGVGS